MAVAAPIPESAPVMRALRPVSRPVPRYVFSPRSAFGYQFRVEAGLGLMLLLGLKIGIQFGRIREGVLIRRHLIVSRSGHHDQDAAASPPGRGD